MKMKTLNHHPPVMTGKNHGSMITRDIPLLHSIHQKRNKLEPNRSYLIQCIDIDNIKAVDFH